MPLMEQLKREYNAHVRPLTQQQELLLLRSFTAFHCLSDRLHIADHCLLLDLFTAFTPWS